MDKAKEERIEAYRNRIRELLGEDFPEAGGHAEVTVMHKGIEYQVSQRASNPYDALAALVYSVAFMQHELDIKVSPSSPETQKPANGSSPSGTSSSGNGNTKTDTMPVEVIKLGKGGERPYWIVKGGKWKKHGVICWPEVLEDIGILESLDPFAENRPREIWMAKYIKKDNGNPDKIVEFIPAKKQ